MNRLKFAILVLCISMFSCSRVNDTEKFKVIDLTQALKESQKISLSDIASDVEYIQLETTEGSLISKGVSFFANADYIIAISFRRILLFNRKNGRFLREISNYGRNPGSYNGTIEVLPFNEEANTVYARGAGKKLEFSLNGDLIDQIGLPPNSFTTAKIDNEKHIGYVPNFGNEKAKLVVFDSNGEIEKTYPNFLSAPKPTGMMIYKPNGWFYRHHKQLYFCEQFNDTLFQVTTNDVIPRFVLDRGQYTPPYDKQTVGFALQDYFIFNSVYESDKFLFYSFIFEKQKFTAVYDKESEKVFLGNYSSQEGSGFIIDFDNFSTVNLSSINSQNEMIGFVEAYDIVQWFDDNPDPSINLPDKLKGYKSIKDTDNPVVIIAKLRSD